MKSLFGKVFCQVSLDVDGRVSSAGFARLDMRVGDYFPKCVDGHIQ